MRIGIVAPEFPPEVGGVETYSYEISAELARRGHNVFVFTCRDISGSRAGQGFEVLPELHLQYARDRLLPTRFRMDVWHVMNAAFAWLALETRPVIVSVHGNDFINPYFLSEPPALPQSGGLWRLHGLVNPLQAWLWRKMAIRTMGKGLSLARQVIANSEYTKCLLTRYYPSCKATTSVGFVGVGEEYLQARRADCGSRPRKRLITLCRLAEPRKNVDKVLEALARLKSYDFEYTVIGDGHMRPDLESLCRRIGLEDRVRFTGSLPKTEIRRLLTTSDLFILTSAMLQDSVEGFGIAYLEANACGTPVLACRAGGAVEAVDEGRSGYFVEEPTVPEISAALERFLSGQISFHTSACQNFAARFTWSKVVDHALQFYH